MFKTLKIIWESLAPRDKRYLALALWAISIIGFLAIFIFPLIFTQRAPLKWMEYDNSSGNVANTINGVATPFIALASAFLTFLAFWVQYQANIQQRNLFDEEVRKQKEDAQNKEQIWRIDRFENRFYELLKLHKDNVVEMNIADKIKGRKCFVQMFYELRHCYRLAEKITKQNGAALNMPAGFNLLNFVYRIFFFGIGSNSEKHFIHYFSPYEQALFTVTKENLTALQQQFENVSRDVPNLKYATLNIPLSGIRDDDTIDFYYYPYDGHVNRLGHYYRHLFQTANFIVSQDILNRNEKYNYVKMLRAQLSNFEQLMLYYNALAWFDKEWHILFTDYRLLKNLPLPLADFHITPEEFFNQDILRLRDEGIEMFEWHE